MLRYFFALLPVLVIGFICSAAAGSVDDKKSATLRYFCDFEKTDSSSFWMNTNAIAQGQGNHFSHTDSLQPYGIGFRSSIAEGDGSHSYKARLSFKMRVSAISAKPKVVFAIEQNGVSAFWDSKDLISSIKRSDEWFFVDGLEQVLPAGYTTKDYQFVCYVWNSDGTAAVDVDDFQLELERLPARSFLPSAITTTKIAQGEYIDLYRGPFFSLQFDKVNGQCRITESNQQVVFESFLMFQELRAGTKSDPQQSWFTFLTYTGDSLSEDGKVFQFRYRSTSPSVLKLVIPTDGRSLRVDFSCTVAKTVKLERQSLVIKSKVPVSKIYTGQGNVQTAGFLDEYWLNKEGVTWSTASSEWSIYHPDKVSSLQLDHANNKLWVNADYSGDHPLLYWPLETSSRNYRVDRSYSTYEPGDRIEGSFTLMRKEGTLPLPRFLDARNGREAVLIFTEHADYTSMRSNKAVYFGADTVANANQAVGGFVRYSIPVTKSIFYANPDKLDFSQRAGFIQEEIATFKNNDGFRTFLSELELRGHEIALHTPDHYTTNKLLLAESLKEMSGLFNMKSWIDHGYDNSKRSNREDLVCDGFVSGSAWYAAPLFKEYGMRNLWNCFYEDSSLYEPVTFNSELVTPHPAFGFAYPRPVQWTHPTVTDDLLHLRTTCTLAPSDGSMWEFFLGEKRLDFLVKHKGVYVAHVYPARIDSVTAFYTWKSSVWTVDPGFDHVLKVISDYRERGSLWVATMEDYLGYSRDKDQLRFALDRSGFAVITNPTDRKMQGISMCVDGYTVRLTSGEKGRRTIDDTTIFWFDLEPGESITVRLVTPH